MVRKNDTKGSGRKMCPKGLHPMDETWTHCPYCEAQEEMQENEHVNEPVRRRKTVIDSGADAPDAGRVTRMQESASKRDSAEPMDRRIVGVLVTYSRRREGEIFPVREGKNMIGRDEECDICIPEDRKLSGENTLILVRRGQISMWDRQSVNGTFLNGELVDEAKLPDSATLQTGQIQWKFLRINTEDVAEPAVMVHAAAPEREPAEPRRPRTRTAD